MKCVYGWPTPQSSGSISVFLITKSSITNAISSYHKITSRHDTCHRQYIVVALLCTSITIMTLYVCIHIYVCMYVFIHTYIYVYAYCNVMCMSCGNHCRCSGSCCQWFPCVPMMPAGPVLSMFHQHWWLWPIMLSILLGKRLALYLVYCMVEYHDGKK